jgi:hypothetical protein
MADNLGQPGSRKRVRWFAWQTGIPLVILFAIIGLAEILAISSRHR